MLTTLAVFFDAPLLIYLLTKWVGLVRKGSKSAILAGLLLGLGMIPDPLYERIIRVVKKVKRNEEENREEDGESYS